MKLRDHQKDIIATMQQKWGQVLVPTGGGKTMCMIVDAKWRFSMPIPQTIIVVAPRILLAQQLCEEFLEQIDNVEVLHVHSGETNYKTTTNPKEIQEWHHNSTKNQLIFTTYHSLHRILEDVEADTVYYDEAHNSVQKNFFESVKNRSNITRRKFYFTATPKHHTSQERGMNNTKVYGQVIAQIPAPELIEKGYIVPPQIKTRKFNVGFYESVEEIDKEMILDALDNEESMDKVLVTAKSTTNIHKLITRTDFQSECHARKYNVMWITSKYGAIINGKKITRKTFFNLMNKWGNDPDKKFLLFHHSILSEGMNVSGLNACILLRNLDLITMAQTIGRVIRLHKEDAHRISTGALKPCVKGTGYVKPFGKMFVPVYNNVGIGTERRLNNVVDTIFNKGEAQVSLSNRK